ncbi:hypothetical protein [Tenacibaculum amylolyticum]|uniref:hypothetical protein n=1 Tax=Tenacibaculum amylolyticum TaxID=104269 RepID=UPI0038950CDE
MKSHSSITIVKIVIYLLILCVINSCNLSFEKEKRLREVQAKLKTQLILNNEDKVYELKYFKSNKGNIYSFKANSNILEKVIKQLHMTIDSTGKYIWIPEESPNWFSPSLDYIKTYITDKPNRKEFLQFDEDQNIYYYANLSW